MSNGFVHWYERGWDRHRAESMLDVLERHGIGDFAFQLWFADIIGTIEARDAITAGRGGSGLR